MQDIAKYLDNNEPKIENADDVNNLMPYVPKDELGNITNGTDTFDKLYNDIHVLFSYLCNTHKAVSWKSKRNNDNDENPISEGKFRVGLVTPKGKVGFIVDIKFWNMYDVGEVFEGPNFDSITTDELIDRIGSL